MNAKDWIELVAVLTMPICIISLLAYRYKAEKGLSVRALQFLALGLITPLILILALEGILEKGAAGALLGSLLGYFFSQIGKYDERKAGQPKEDS